MSRPVIKYPTNHHLSQILERWTLNAIYTTPLWAIEVGVFGGNEPEGPWDFSNVESFANSWSTRLSRHFGTGSMHIWTWEVAASFADVKEERDDGLPDRNTRLFNAMLRHEKDYGSSHVYGMLEGSWSDADNDDGYFSILGEASVQRGAHKPYARVEYASRPEYPREGSRATSEFFRYEHDADPLGSTRWLSLTAGYGISATQLPYGIRPYIEAQWHNVRSDEGGIQPATLYGRSSFLSLSAGFRVFLGGDQMRMGAYGVLDAMTLMHRMEMGQSKASRSLPQ